MESDQQKILDEMIIEHKSIVSKSEAKLVNYALEHNLVLCLMGEYGEGRTLNLEDNYYGARGEWVYSRDMC